MPPILTPESLPFVVRPLQGANEYAALLQLRARGYQRHYSQEILDVVEDGTILDRHATLLVAVDKTDHRLLGSLRMRSSLREVVELDTPKMWHELGEDAYLYTDRFVTAPGPVADIVMLALTKAQWFYAYHEGVQWITGICIKALTRRYRQVGLRVLHAADSTESLRLPHAPDVEIFAVGERLQDMPAGLLRVRPSLATFMFDTAHPDICYARPALLDEHVRRARQALVDAQRVADCGRPDASKHCNT